ncbi:MAG: RNA-binding transcriptional accessory protein, partial [Anaerolineales bacterium]|nr:RNA-binding transcriptional accessory protein [Anaerolineales bacterium]
MTSTHLIATSLKIPLSKVEAVKTLLDDGNTIPFIARYRKEATGGLDEDQLRDINEELNRLRLLGDRRETILKSIQEQGLLTAELKKKIDAAGSRSELEDLYLPYKPKRKTKASTARENGLDPLAEMILQQDLTNQTLVEIAEPFLNENIKTTGDAWQGARDIAAEAISDQPQLRQALRKKALLISEITTQKKSKGEDPRQVYQDYYEFTIPVNRIRPHQILAINRAENEGILLVKLSLPDELWRDLIKTVFQENTNSPFLEVLREVIEDAANRLLLPVIFRDVRRTLTDKAEESALNIFAKNLRALLLQPPLAGYTVLGLDPGFRTGCKVAVVDPTGKPLYTGAIYPVPPQNQKEQAREILLQLIKKWNVSLIVIGNGTASRETEIFIGEMIKDLEDISYLITSEAGA